MGFFDRLRGKPEKNVVRPEQLAAVLAGYAGRISFDSNNDYAALRADLEDAFRDTPQARVEFLYFNLLPFDIVACGMWSEFVDRFRPEMFRVTAEFAQVVLSDHFPQHSMIIKTTAVEAQLLAYAELFSDGWTSDALRRLSFAASEKMVGSVDPILAMMLGSRFASMMETVPSSTLRSPRLARK